jgi:hypothetical protein
MNEGSLINAAKELPAKNEEVRRELEAIASRRAGLNPVTVLKVASNPKSCLHRYFCWDDTEAARRFREQQAYELIRTVKVQVITHSNQPVTVRAFFPVKAVAEDGTIDYGKRGNYLPVSDIMNDEEAARQVIARAKSELAAFTQKYRGLASLLDFSEVFRAIDRVVTPRVKASR